LESDSEEAILSESDNEHDEDAATAGCDGNASGNQVRVWSQQHPLNSDGFSSLIGGPSEMRIQEVSNVM
jgi:hypothetical protein